MKKNLFRIVVFISVLICSNAAFAQEYAAKTFPGKYLLSIALAITAGIGIALAAIGGAFGQAKVACTALEGIARNPEAATKIQTPMIIALALIESLVIYALVIAFLLQGKI